jgi:hypothetical protein
LYLGSQLNLFARKMREEIIRLAKEEKEKPKKAREKAKTEIEEFAEKN